MRKTAMAAYAVACAAYLLLLRKRREEEEESTEEEGTTDNDGPESMEEKEDEPPRKQICTKVQVNRNSERTHLVVDRLKELSESFEIFCGMSSEDFEYLLGKIGPCIIIQEDAGIGDGVPTKERLALTLRFLKTGDSFESLEDLFKIPPLLICKIVPEVCQALMKVLEDSIKLPTNEEDWRQIAEDYENFWNFPHCVGSIDSKRIMLHPRHSNESIDNHDYSSLVLTTLADANYCFIYASCEHLDKCSEAAEFQNTRLFKGLQTNQMNLPPDEPINETTLPLPYVFLGDDAFGLTESILTPYSGIFENHTKQEILNTHLSQAHRVAENALGMMTSRFRVLRKPIFLEPEEGSSLVQTCALLHNFLRKSATSTPSYSLPHNFEEDCGNTSHYLTLHKVSRKATAEAESIRNGFADYFISNVRMK